MPLDRKNTTADWLVCNCGNKPTGAGFDPCDEAGSIFPVEQTLARAGSAAWDGVHYLCRQCFAIYNVDTLEQVGIASASVKKANKSVSLED